MYRRIIYTLKEAFKQKHKLAKYKLKYFKKVAKIQDINLLYWRHIGVKAVILDFDGVLASHGEKYPTKESMNWILSCKKVFEDNVFILSNKPMQERKDFFGKNGIKFITSSKKKPYPDGILQILKENNLKQTQALIVDDRLLTGILAAEITKIHGILISKPIVNFTKRPMKEIFFLCLRKLESIFLAFL